jgi:cell division protein FtsB
LLAVVLGALVLSLALPVREYVRQRSEISALQDEKAAREAQVTALESRLKQWDDPAFVATQARQRLQFVMPGEVGYVVLDPAEAPAPAQAKSEAATTPNQQSWYTRLWGSVEKADQPTP